MNKTTCKDCKKEIDENDFVAYTSAGDSLCESCEQSAWEYSNTVVVTQMGEIKTYRWCAEFGYRDAEYWEDAELNSVEGFKYIRTDGWRGYWKPIIGDNYTTLASGWSTGRWDDVSWKHGFNDLVENIQEGKLECPYELVFAFGLTSNVFSVASDVIIRKKDIEKFTEWFCEEAGITIEELQNNLK